MDIFTAFTSGPTGTLSAIGLLGLTVAAILSGLLIPLRTHKRELKAAWTVAEQWRQTAEAKDTVNAALLTQNSNLLAGVRIADKFYSDFVTPIDEATRPPGASHVGA